MKIPEMYVIQCGRMYLGAQGKGRAGCVENAARFTNKVEAELKAAQMRAISGIVRLPWTVQTVGVGGVA